MKNLFKVCSLIASLAISTASNAGFVGKTIEATAFYPDLAAPTFTAGPITKVVGAGIEFTDGEYPALLGLPRHEFC